MKNSLHSNKIHQIYSSIHHENIDRSQIQLYRSQIKYIKDFQNKEKGKIQKNTNIEYVKIKNRNNSEKYNKKNYLMNSIAVPKKAKENHFLSSLKTKNIFDNEIRLYEYDLKNYNANYIKDLENITNKIQQRYVNLNKDEHNKINHFSKNESKHKRNILKIPFTANIKNNSAIKYNSNENNDAINDFECNSFKSLDLKRKDNNNINLTSDLIKMNILEKYEQQSKLDKLSNCKEKKESEKKDFVQENINSSKKSVKFNSEYEQLNKQLNDLYYSNSRNKSSLNQNQILSKDIVSNIEKITKSSIFELTKSSENFLFDRTPKFKKLNSCLDTQDNLVKNNHEKIIAEKILKNYDCHKNISNDFKISEKNENKNNENLIHSIFPKVNKGFSKIYNKNCIKKSIDNNKKNKNNESIPSKDMLKSKISFNKNERKINQNFIINSENCEKKRSKAKIGSHTNGIHNKNHNVLEDNFNSDKNSNKIDKKGNIDYENSSRNKIKRVSILKYTSNQTYKSGSTAAPSNNDIITASMINNKTLVDVDDSYGVKNFIKNFQPYALNSKDTYVNNIEIFTNSFKKNTNTNNNNSHNNSSSKNNSFKDQNQNINSMINTIESNSKKCRNNIENKKDEISKTKENLIIKKFSSLTSSSNSLFNESFSSIEIDIEKLRKKENDSNKLSNNNKNNKSINSLKLRSTNKNLPYINKDEFNCEVYIAKINREIKRKKKIPFFRNTFNLNNYLIRDFKIGQQSDPKYNSKKKYTMTEKLHMYNENKRRSVRDEYIKSIFNSVKQKNDDNFNFKKIIINDLKQREISGVIDENEEVNEDKLNFFMMEQEILDKKNKERIFKKSKEIADKIIELNNEESYESFDQSFDMNVNKVSKKNIEKVIKLKKILKNDYLDEMDLIADRSANKVRKIKEETQDLLTLTLHKLGPPGFLKKKFKNETVKKFQTVNGKYFGC